MQTCNFLLLDVLLCVNNTTYLLRQHQWVKCLFSFFTQPLVTAKIAAEYSYNDDKILAPSHPNENFESSNASLTNGADTETLSSTSELIDKVKRSNLEKGLSEQAVGASDSAKSGGLVVYNPSVGRVGSGKQVHKHFRALILLTCQVVGHLFGIWPGTGYIVLAGSRYSPHKYVFQVSYLETSEARSRSSTHLALMYPKEGSETTALVVNRRKMTSAPTPEWHAPWKLQSVVSVIYLCCRPNSGLVVRCIKPHQLNLLWYCSW